MDQLSLLLAFVAAAAVLALTPFVGFGVKLAALSAAREAGTQPGLASS